MTRWTRMIVLALGALAASRVSAQAERLDHPGLAVPRLRALCGARAPGTPIALQVEQRTLRDSLNKPAHRDDADLARTLGCVAAMLYVNKPMVKNGRELVRSPNAMAAADAFMQVLRARATDSVAAVGLATVVLDVGESSDVSLLVHELEDLARTSYDAVRGGVSAPIVLRMCTQFTIAVADFATARRCMDRALAQGVDSSWHLERAALLSFFLGEAFAGAAWFEGAISVAHDSAARSDVAWHVAALIDTMAIPPARILAQWAPLTDSARVIWLRRNVEHGAAFRGEAAPYLDRLARTFLDPHFQGPILEHCPPNIFRNGAEQVVDHSACISNVPGGGKPLQVTAQLLRLWNPVSGVPIGVVGYALDRHGLKPDSGRYDSRTVSVAFNLRQYEWETGGWRDTTLRATRPLPNDIAAPPVTGYLVVPLFRGTLTSTFAASQGEVYGAISTEGPLAIGDRGYTLSDLVLGVAEQSLVFPFHGDTVTLAPLNTVKRKKPVELYYQLRTDSNTADLRTDIVLHRIMKGEVLPEAEITLTSRTPAHAGINVVHRELNIAALVNGDHQLDLKLRDAAGKVVAERTVNLLVR